MALNETDQKDVLLALLAEHGSAMREKSQPEYVYTAAALAGFGAVSWGVAALQPASYANRFWTHPAAIAAAGVFFTAVALIAKSRREHAVYQRIRAGRAAAAASLKALLGENGNLVPDEFLKGPSGGGAYYSLGAVVIAALGSIAFSLSVLFR
jgi:hypothetical protein